MHRRVVQSLYLSSLRRVPILNQFKPCSLYEPRKGYCDTTHKQTWTSSLKFNSEEKYDFSQSDADKFGTLNAKPEDINTILDQMPKEVEDRREFNVTNEEGKKQRRPIMYYHKLIKRLLEEKKIVDALDVLETRMLLKDKVKPDYYTYNLLINGCAKVGYSKKAFKLYRRMKDSKIKRTAATYTGLFNACAESPEQEDALIKLNNLRKNLQNEGVVLNIICYNAMIKAYARLKDLMSAFQVVDEIISKDYTLRPETFAFLLQACISDKECGMRHALMTWHKLKQKKVKIDLHHYNLFIRCVRDCGFGDEEDLKDAINFITNGAAKFSTITLESGTTSDKKLLEEPCDGDSNECKSIPPLEKSENSELKFEEIETMPNRPNLLAKKPHLGSIIAVKNVTTPTDRLLLLGGYRTFFKEMNLDGIKPDIKTFTQLLNIIPSAKSSEDFLMEEMKKYNVDINIEFCNTLIKQRAMRLDYEGAKDVLSIIQENYLQPDIMTFGVMAMSCRHQWEALELIKNMKSFSMRLNAEILGAMLCQACYHTNYNYAIFLMKQTKRQGIKPNETYMKHLSLLETRTIKLRRALKKNQPVPQFVKDSKFREDSRMFSEYLAQWKKDIEIFKSPHPFKQFRKSTKVDENNTEKCERKDERLENVERRRRSFKNRLEFAENDSHKFNEGRSEFSKNNSHRSNEEGYREQC